MQWSPTVLLILLGSSATLFRRLVHTDRNVDVSPNTGVNLKSR